MILTVIIPIYNVEKYLKKTLNSVLNQKINDFEIILVDDGSTDESGAICDEFAEKDTRIRVFHITNGGVSRARNFGLAQATGDYIHFMDSDDLIEPEMYEQFSNIVKKEYPDIVMCGSLQINSRHHTEMVVAPEQEAFLNGRNQIAEYLNQIPLNDMKCLIHYIWNKWYRREFLLKYKLSFSPTLNLGEDYVFNCTALKSIEKICKVPNTYYHYFIRGNSLVSAFQSEPWKSRQMLFDAHKELYESFGIWSENKNAIMLEEGKMCFAALRSVNSSRCELSFAEKTAFLRKFSDSEQMKLTVFYLKNSGKNLHRVWLFLIQKFNLFGIRIMLLADYAERRIRG